MSYHYDKNTFSKEQVIQDRDNEFPDGEIIEEELFYIITFKENNERTKN